MVCAAEVCDRTPPVPFTGYRARVGPPTVVIGGGKGGVGKSAVTGLLGIAAARRGRRVLLVDGDFNRADLHVLLDVEPVATIDDVLGGAVRAADIAIPVTDHLWLSPGVVGSERLYATGAVDRARLFHQLAQSFDDFDLVVIDAGSAIDDVLRACTVAATHLVLVTVAEPAALADTFGLARLVHATLAGLPIDLLVNRVATAREGSAVLAALHAAGRRFLKRDLGVLGCLLDDDVVHAAVRGARPLLDVIPDSAMASAIDRLIDTRRLQFGFPPITPETTQGAVS